EHTCAVIDRQAILCYQVAMPLIWSENSDNWEAICDGLGSR
ncbi:hypothetical protein B0813_002701, partial [Candidatus Fervidibacteria bacterium JGI MDM2 SSWTFF-3-K9]